jgi:hypothetical protein
MRGSLVIARDYSGTPLVRRVWESCSKLIYLSEDGEFQKLSTGGCALSPVGFPVEDVFVYDPVVFEKLAGGLLEWGSLRPVTAGPSSQLGTFVSSE